MGLGPSARAAGTVRVCSVAQLCSTLCDPIDSSSSGSSAHGILQYWSG